MLQATGGKRRWFIPWLVMAALLAVASGCRQAPVVAPTPLPPTAPANQVTLATGVGWVSAEGRLVPLQEAPLSVPVTGRVADLLVAEGDQVTAGAPLLRLESANQEAAQEQAQTQVSLAAAALAAAQADLAAAQSEQALAALAVDAAAAQLALLQAGPSAAQTLVGERTVAAAEASISAATGRQALLLQPAPAAQILAAESRLVSAQAAEKQVRDALFFEEHGRDKAQLELQLAAATANVQAAQAVLTALQAGATAAERAVASLAIEQAAARRDESLAQLALLQAGSLAEAIAVARLEVQVAEAAEARAEKGVVQAETAVAQAEAAVTQALTALQAAEVELALLTLTAPFAGTVAAITYHPGEVASPGTAAVLLVDFDGWLVQTTDLNERDVIALAAGMPAEIRLDALPGEKLSGRISRIAPAATLVAGDVRYQVSIRLDDPGPLPLRWGMTALVDIEVD